MEPGFWPAETVPEEAVVAVSDVHMADGLILPDGKRNPLEEFESDTEFLAFVAEINERTRNVPMVRLILLGDTFDSQAVLFCGRNDDTPYETVHRYKIRRIMKAHPVFFDALKEFLSRPGRSIDFFIGNHDFFLEWKSVQKIIVNRVSPAHPEKIRFLYKEECRGVHYFHGNFEPHSAIKPTQIYLTERFGIKLKRPLLNYPYGTFLTVELTNKLKRKNRLIGRLRTHEPIWRESLFRDWGFGFYALAVLLWNFLYNRFFAFWDIRRKAQLGTTLRIVLWTITGYDLEEYARRIFDESPDTQVVIAGHDHEAARATVSRGRKKGTYINTGTWTKFFDVADEPIVYKWRQRFRPIERWWRKFVRFSKRRQIKAVTRLTFALVSHYPDGSLNAELFEYRPNAPKDRQIIEVV